MRRRRRRCRPIRSDPSQADAIACVSVCSAPLHLSFLSLSPCTRLRQLCACAGARQNNNKADTHTQHKKQRDTKTGHCLNGSAERKSNSLLSSFPSLFISLSVSDSLQESYVDASDGSVRCLHTNEAGSEQR